MNTLFNSLTAPIPPVRPDLQRIPIKHRGESLVYIYDMLGYVPENMSLAEGAEPILSLMNGQHSVQDIHRFVGSSVSPQQILDYIRHLDEHLMLQSGHFLLESESLETRYESSAIHESTTAGSSYPADPDNLRSFLDDAFKKVKKPATTKPVRALYAPHIDLRVGLSTYTEAFSHIADLKPTKVILLATSHYSGLYPGQYLESPFIISEKTFRMPNGDVSTDPELYAHALGFAEQKGELSGISFQDRAHRIEHSIELHLLFLNHIWNHDFRILPVLVGGMDELLYSENSFREQQLTVFSGFLKELADDDTLFLISGDLSHTGHKFGDEQDAMSMTDEVRKNDERFMQTAEDADPSAMIGLMKENMDVYRICGFPPLLTYLKAGIATNGTTINYDRWEELERSSAVTFGSILF